MKSHVVPGVELRATLAVFRKELGILQPMVAMSRRKQSNPKPLKREDEEDNPQSTEATIKPEPADSPRHTQTPPSPPSPPLPRVRLNAALATDPGAGSEIIKRATPPPTLTPPTRSSETPPARAGIEYLAALQQHALATATRLFPASIPDTDVVAIGKPAALRTKGEQPGVVIETRAVPIYMCSPCGIRFSSVSTLEAHQTYYCSHRVQPKARESDGDDPKSPSAEDGPTPAKTPRTGKQYACPHCSYSADKKVSLNRHMRMHTASPGVPNGSEVDAPVDRYCQDCDIRFSSVKTLKAHKLHYCGSRHGGKASPASKASSAPGSPASPARVTPESQSFLVLRTDPILIVPYSLLQSASIYTGGATLPSQDTACIVLNDGTVQPMSQLVQNSNESVLRMRGERNALKEAASPLDLSVRRSSETDLVIDEDEKENVFSSSPHEDIICAPSIPALLASEKRSPSRKSDSYSTSPSPPSPIRKPSWKSPNGVINKNETVKMEPKMPGVGRPSPNTPTPELIPNPLLPLINDLPIRVGGLLGGQMLSDPSIPQVLVKQGTSKCKECNIVFCKPENYLAHKKHYCSARPSEATDEARASPGSKSPGSAKDPNESKCPSPGKPMFQFICAPCGIKFTALDNLTAHQAYYCPKRAEGAKVIDEKPRRCPKCKLVAAADHQCLPPAAGWKCLCCDVVSPTAASAQKHMEAHTGVRAFRCTICKYKGNTLRGMRTHIRMHFDKKNLDLQEENYISCIVDEETTSATTTAANGELIPTPLPTINSSNATSPVIVKQETAEDELVDVEADPLPAQQPSESGDEEIVRRPGSNHCQSCNITFTYPASFIAHKQFYCATHTRTRTSRTTTPETSVQ